MHCLFTCAAVLLLPALALASPSCRIAYAEFEPNVPHIDLVDCPGRPEREGVFCRAQIQGVHITIYRFEPGPDGSSCLTDAESMAIRDFINRFGHTTAGP